MKPRTLLGWNLGRARASLVSWRLRVVLYGIFVNDVVYIVRTPFRRCSLGIGCISTANFLVQLEELLVGGSGSVDGRHCGRAARPSEPPFQQQFGPVAELLQETMLPMLLRELQTSRMVVDGSKGTSSPGLC